MCIGIVTSQREGGVGLGYLHQSLASLITGAQTLLLVLRSIISPHVRCEQQMLATCEH